MRYRKTKAYWLGVQAGETSTGGNPFDWTKERNKHNQWGAGYAHGAQHKDRTMSAPIVSRLRNGAPAVTRPKVAATMNEAADTIEALCEALQAIEGGCDNLRPGHVAYKSKADIRAIAQRALAKVQS